MTPDERELRIRAGLGAERLLRDETVKAAKDELVSFWFQQWRKTAPNAQEEREECWRILRGIDEVFLQLAAMKERGKEAGRSVEDSK